MDLHHARLDSALALAVKYVREWSQTANIHQVFSWDEGEWCFVVIDEATQGWNVLLYREGTIIDFTEEFAKPPTMNLTYSDEEALFG